MIHLLKSSRFSGFFPTQPLSPILERSAMKELRCLFCRGGVEGRRDWACHFSKINKEAIIDLVHLERLLVVFLAGEWRVEGQTVRRGRGPEARLRFHPHAQTRGPTTQPRGGVSEEPEGDSSRDSLRRQPLRKSLGGSRRSERGSAAPTPHPGAERRAEVALVWPEPLGEFVRRGEGVMSSRLGAVPAVSFSV